MFEVMHKMNEHSSRNSYSTAYLNIFLRESAMLLQVNKLDLPYRIILLGNSRNRDDTRNCVFSLRDDVNKTS